MCQGFIADAMLGKLVRWLRFLGYDTLYDVTWDDPELVRIARAQNRVLLTRDAQLAKRSGVQILLVKSQVLEVQLDKVIQCYHYTKRNGPRCPVCNTALSTVNKSEAWDNVPLYVFAENNEFSRCPGCGSFYWPGTQWRRIRLLLDQVTSRIDT